MNRHDDPAIGESDIAFARLLPRRVDAIGRRLQRFLRQGWDINGLVLIEEEAQWLGEACGRHELLQPGESLLTLAGLVHGNLAEEALPDPTLGERLQNLFEQIQDATPRLPEPTVELPALRPVGNSARAESPPHGYWRRWGGDAEPPAYDTVAPASPRAALAAAAEEFDPWGPEAPRYGRRADEHLQSLAQVELPPGLAIPGRLTITPVPASAAPVAPAEPAAASASAEPVHLEFPAGIRIYHLTGHDPLSLELDQRLESAQVEIELLEDIDELEELLGALPADLVLVDATFNHELERIGLAVRNCKLRGHRAMQLAVMAEADDIALRLGARRAGVDLLIAGAHDANDVLRRLQALLDPQREAPYRVLIVEDDRSQALFAEGILRNAGMDSLVVLDALGVLPALQHFHPDLILMDLNMPDANGIELTALIREQDEFLQTPIVFLSGESDEDRQFDAIDAGGDDFLAKPIRPRHLISAVQNRVRRHRTQEQRRQQRPGKDSSTGLHDRAAVLELLAARLSTGADSSRPGGVLFLEIESIAVLRERLGLTALEQVLTEAGKLLTGAAEGLPAARFGDGSYLVLAGELEDGALEALASQLRAALVQSHFQAQGQPLRLRVSVGICAFRHGFRDTGAVLTAVEKATREARTQERGIRRYEPPKASEAQREAALLAQLRDAVQAEHLELLYQPVVAVAGSDDSQFQVLLRMRDQQGRLRSAAEIIPVAEQAGFIVDIDRWVLAQALTLIHDRHGEGQELRLFVTQSPVTLADSSQAGWLQSELAAHGVPGTSLVMELRLDDAAVHIGTVRQFCESLVGDGVQFCLSQFEYGRDGDALLEQLPLGFVKLARKYTSGNLSPALRDELKTLIERSHRRGLEVIGHGVEDAQAAATLWMSGIDYIQGNLVQQANQDLDFDFHQAVL